MNVTDLKDSALCPAIPWIRRRLGWKEPETSSMSLGKKFRSDLEKVVQDPLWEVFLRDRATGLTGRVDLLGRDIVAEIKSFPRGRIEHFRLQLLAYSFLAERNGYRIRWGLLFTGNRERLRIEVRKEHLEEVERRVNRLAEILEEGGPPVVNPGHGLCLACQYRRMCPVTPVA